MKFCAACHQDLPKDKFSKKQWKLGAQIQRRCTSCVRDNRAVQQPPPAINNESDNNNTGIVSSLDSMSINDDEMIPVSDEELFKQPPQKEDCPICFLCMPSLMSGYKYKVCCGKTICSGCIHAVEKLKGDTLCPFCRTLAPISEREIVERTKKRLELKDAMAFFNLGCKYNKGTHGCSQNRIKAIELWHRAGKLGHAGAYNNIGQAYYNGDGIGVGVDKKKAYHYFELAAMGGNVDARYNLGIDEYNKGNIERALKHWMIGVEFGGDDESLKNIKKLLMRGKVTKDDYANAIRVQQAYLDVVRSDQRDEAAAFADGFKYY